MAPDLKRHSCFQSKCSVGLNECTAPDTLNRYAIVSAPDEFASDQLVPNRMNTAAQAVETKQFSGKPRSPDRLRRRHQRFGEAVSVLAHDRCRDSPPERNATALQSTNEEMK